MLELGEEVSHDNTKSDEKRAGAGHVDGHRQEASAFRLTEPPAV